MRKLTLHPDDLRVESFETLSAAAGLRRTVRGHQEEPDTEEPTCGNSCPDTCGESCDTPCIEEQSVDIPCVEELSRDLPCVEEN